MAQNLAGNPGNPDENLSAAAVNSGQSPDGEAAPVGAPGEPGGSARPQSAPADIERARFLGRIVVVFSLLCALVLTISAIASGQYLVIVGGLGLVAASVCYYVWMMRGIERMNAKDSED